MPGLDYLDQSADPRDDSYFNGLTSAVVEIGGMVGGGALANQYARRKATMNKPGVATYNKARLAYAGKMSNPSYAQMAAQSPLLNPDRVRGLINQKHSGTLARRAAVKDWKKMSSTLGKASTVYGLFTATVMGWQIGSELVRGSRAFAESSDDIAQRRRMDGLYSGNDEYFDSRAAFTQRQRALQVIHNSQLSTRAALGSEAGFLHY